MRIAQLRSDDERVAALTREALALSRELGSRRGLTASFESFAWVARVRGDSERAARLLGAADALRDAVGARLPEPDRDPYEAELTIVRAALGEAAFAAAWAEGQAMSLEHAITDALEVEVPA